MAPRTYPHSLKNAQLNGYPLRYPFSLLYRSRETATSPSSRLIAKLRWWRSAADRSLQLHNHTLVTIQDKQQLLLVRICHAQPCMEAGLARRRRQVQHDALDLL